LQQMDLAIMSSSQRRLWFMSQVAERNPFYNVTLTFRLHFAVDCDALECALKMLVNRHEILRTRYPVIDGIPRQEITDTNQWHFFKMSMPEPPDPTATDVMAEEYPARIARSIIDLEKGPVFCAYFLSMASEDHLLTLVTHHIAIDQWSIKILVNELNHYYDAIVEGRNPELPLATQYRKYAVWEMERAAKRAQSARFWDKQLLDAPLPLLLPYDRPLPQARNYLGREVRGHLDETTGKCLEALCKRHHSSIFAGIFALWSVLLNQHTGQNDMFLGTTSAFREKLEFKTTLGCFVNTLLVPMHIQPGDSFQDVLLRARDQILAVLDNYDVSYDHIIQKLRSIHPDYSGEPIKAYVQYQPKSLLLANLADLRFCPNLGVHNGRAKFEIMLNASRREEGLDYVIEYDSDLFTESKIKQMSEDLLLLFQYCLDDPGSPLPEPDQAPEAAAPAAAIRTTSMTFRTAGTNVSLFEYAQQQLKDIWKNLLFVQDVTPEDGFISLGGHSLLFAQMAWHIREQIGIRVAVGDLQRSGTFGAILDLITNCRADDVSLPDRASHGAQDVGGILCQLELGSWDLKGLAKLMADARLKPSANERLFHVAWALWGTPFQFESRLPIPSPGQIPIRLGTFDCITYVYMVIALSAARDLGEFIHFYRDLRYVEAEDREANSNFESGTLLAFAEESLFRNACEMGILKDVTAEVFDASLLETLETTLIPVQLPRSLSPQQLWATPKLGPVPIRKCFLPKMNFTQLSEPNGLRNGDVIVMSRGQPHRGRLIDHVAFVHLHDGDQYLLQSTRHFAWQPDASLATPGAFTGVFYDDLHQKEQIGVGITGPYAGESVAFTRDEIAYHGYECTGWRTMKDYLDSNFTHFLVLRLCDESPFASRSNKADGWQVSSGQ
jgi:acyl carrier protein